MDIILKAYVTDTTNTKPFTDRLTMLVNKYTKSGITRENIPVLVGSLVMEVKSLKRLTGPEKKELVLDLIHMMIEKIDEGDEDTEFEKILKAMVPPMIDSFALMLKVNKVCSCLK